MGTKKLTRHAWKRKNERGIPLALVKLCLDKGVVRFLDYDTLRIFLPRSRIPLKYLWLAQRKNIRGLSVIYKPKAQTVATVYWEERDYSRAKRRERREKALIKPLLHKKEKDYEAGNVQV